MKQQHYPAATHTWLRPAVCSIQRPGRGHTALQDLPAKPASVTLFFDARVRTGDWVRTMVALLVSRHGIQISLAHTAPGHCASTAAVVARLDANDARPLSAGQDDALRTAMQSVCQMETQPVAVRRV